MIGWDIFGWLFVAILVALMVWHGLDYFNDRRN